MIEKLKIDEQFFKGFEFCCHLLSNNITLEHNKREGQTVMYNPAIRGYSMSVINKNDFISPINFCPYCGQKFPMDLAMERMRIIEHELGKQFVWHDGEEYSDFESRLPEEFKTDEWWVKRGL